MQTQLQQTINGSTDGRRKKILFATMPMDGHFNPLTSLAVHLKEQGYEVRWYTGNLFKEKLKAMGIPHYPFKKAKEITQHNIDAVFPERKKLKGIKKLCFDMSNYFILRGPEFLADIQHIHQDFPFDVVIADICFTGIPFIKDVLKIPVISIGVIPLVEQSKDIAPAGLGLTPATTYVGKKAYQLFTVLVNKLLLKEPNQLLLRLLSEHDITAKHHNVFDILVEKSSVLLQVGTPGFEYRRTDMSRHIHFTGALLPFSGKKTTSLSFEQKLHKYRKVFLVTQGTMEPDTQKLIIPTLEAFKGTDNLLLVATAGNHTAALREKYPFENIVIEDYIDFSRVMPYVDVFISNGGYGGVLLSIMNKLPMVVGGKHEGKNEICARVGFFKLGVDLKTETPGKAQVKAAVEKVLSDDAYKRNVESLAQEFNRYDPVQVCEQYIKELTGNTGNRAIPLPDGILA